MANEVKIICKNVFKNEDKETLAECLTSKWAELINQYEETKGTVTTSNK